MRRMERKNKSGWLRRVAAMSLALTMVLSVLPIQAFAATPEASYNTKLTLQKVATDGTWYLNPTTALPSNSSAAYFSATVKIDGADKKIAFENTGSQLVVWAGFFEVYSPGVPTTSLEIPAGTVLKECTTTAGWGDVAGGTQITIDKTLKVINDGAGNWGSPIEPEATVDTVLSFSNVDAGNAWYFSSSETLPSTANAAYFSATIKVDGADKKVAFENTGTKLVVWSGFFEVYSSGLPTTSLEIPAGTVFSECATTGAWDEILGGTQIKATKTVKVEKDGSGNWNAVIEPEATYETQVELAQVDGGGNWYFNSTETLPSTASAAYFSATVKVDGADKKIVFENSGSQLVVWSGFFEVYTSGVPTQSMTIPAGTVLSEITASGSWPEIIGGTQIQILETLTITKDGSGNWSEEILPEAVCNTKAEFSQVDGGGNWYFNSTETLPTNASAPYFSATVKVDGAEKKIVFENSGTQLVVWANFFEVYSSGVPTSSLEIPEGTILSEITPSGAWDAIVGGTQIQITESLKVKKDGSGNWSTTVEPEAVCESNLGFHQVDSGNNWYFTSSATLPTNANAPYFSAVVKIDGVEKKVAFENNGTQLVVWASFFDVYGASAPALKLEIPAGTVLYEIDTTSGWSEILGGTQIVAQADVTVVKDGSGNWEEAIIPEAAYETKLNFGQVDGSNTWYFNSTETLPTNAGAPYFTAVLQIDGVDTKIAFENTGTQLVVWAGFFELYGGSVPTESVEIPAGTVLYEMSTSDWNNVLGGTQITVTDALKVEKQSSGSWGVTVTPEAEFDTEIMFHQVDGSGTWYFNTSSALPSAGSAPYFSATVKIDGEDKKIALENNGTQLVIWSPGFFEVYGAAVPTTSFEIPAGTVLYEMSTSDWNNVSGGTEITVTKTLKINKSGNDWIAEVEPEAVYQTIMNFSKINVDSTWHFTTADELPKASEAQYFVATVLIDGKEVKIALENDGAELKIWSPGFFEVAGGSVPSESFEIPAGTIFYEANTAGWSSISGGTQIIPSNTLKVVHAGAGNWVVDVTPEAICNTKLSLRTVDVLGTWYITSSQILPKVSDAKFFIATIMIDGKETKIALENDGTQLVIWKSFFEVFGGSAPTTSLVIPNGTILYEMNDKNWSSITGGTQIILTEELNAKNDSDGTWGVGATPAPKKEENTLNFVRTDFMTLDNWVTGSAMKSGSFSVKNGVLKGTVRGNSSGETLLSFSGSDYLKLKAGAKYKVVITYKSSVSFGVFMNLKSNAWTEAPGVCAATENGEWATLSATFRATAGDAFNGALIQSWNSGSAHDIQIKEFCISRDDDTVELTKEGTIGKLPECEGEDDPLGRFVYEWILYTKEGKSIVMTDEMSMDRVRNLVGSTGTYYAYERMKCVHHMDDGEDYGKEPTCTEGGWAPYYICRNCQAILSDYLCTVEIADLEEWKAGEGKLDPTGHEDMTEELAMDGTVYYRCKCGKLFELDGETYVEVSESVLNTTNPQGDDLTVSQTPDSETNSDIWTVVYIAAGVIVVGAAAVVILILRRKSKTSKSV